MNETKPCVSMTKVATMLCLLCLVMIKITHDDGFVIACCSIDINVASTQDLFFPKSHTVLGYNQRLRNP